MSNVQIMETLVMQFLYRLITSPLGLIFPYPPRCLTGSVFFQQDEKPCSKTIQNNRQMGSFKSPVKNVLVKTRIRASKHLSNAFSI